MTDRLTRLLRVYRGDVAAVRRRLETDARLTLMRFSPTPTRPRLVLGKLIGPDAIAEHIDSLIKAGVIDALGRRIARDEHGRTIYRDDIAGRWYRLDHGKRVYLDD